jgi:hypothetical protein
MACDIRPAQTVAPSYWSLAGFWPQPGFHIMPRISLPRCESRRTTIGLNPSLISCQRQSSDLFSFYRSSQGVQTTFPAVRMQMVRELQKNILTISYGIRLSSFPRTPAHTTTGSGLATNSNKSSTLPGIATLSSGAGTLQSGRDASTAKSLKMEGGEELELQPVTTMPTSPGEQFFLKKNRKCSE